MREHPSPFACTDTVAPTVAAVPVLAQTTVIIIFGLIVARMTAGAVRLIGGCRPDDRLRVTGMAGGATQIAGMVARVSGRHVPEGRWQPGVSGVTGIAVLRGDKMPRLFIVRMTTGAAAGHILMVEGGRQPGDC